MIFHYAIDLCSASETFDWAKALGEVLGFPFVIFLKGDMGAGKTLITSGLVAGLGLTDDVSSPTYTIVNEYHDPKTVYHFDLYRLASRDELDEMGFEDYLSDSAGMIIEWPDLLEGQDFESLLEIKIEGFLEDQEKRHITITTTDAQMALDLQKLGGSW